MRTTVQRVKRSYRKTEYVSEIRTTIYLSKLQHDTLMDIAEMNKKKNEKRAGSKKKPESVAQLIRAAVNRHYIHPYLDYHVDKKKQKKKKKEMKKGSVKRVMKN